MTGLFGVCTNVKSPKYCKQVAVQPIPETRRVLLLFVKLFAADTATREEEESALGSS